MFKALLYCNYTSTNLQLYFYSDVIYLARYHTAIPIFHIFNFLSAKNAAKPAPQFYLGKYCSVNSKTPPALRPTALASFLCFPKNLSLIWEVIKAGLSVFLAPAFSKIWEVIKAGLSVFLAPAFSKTGAFF